MRKHLDEYRDPSRARELIARIRAACTRKWRIMEVCGGQTHGLLRSGIDGVLEECIELIHGPGCPVCVTPAEILDQAIHISQQPGVILATFGDMLRVPGTHGSLAEARARGGSIQVVYSPLDALTLAAEHPDQRVVFLAVGFETTAPATALVILQAEQRKLFNFSLLASHVRVLPAMKMLLEQNASGIDAFLAAGHVCTVTGYTDHEELSRTFRKPMAVSGFEPVDLLRGVLACVEILEAGQGGLVNCYERSVRQEGNLHAREIIEKVYCVADVPWRGLGWIPQGGLVLRPAWQHFDARQLFCVEPTPQAAGNSICRAAEVLRGTLKPPACAAFGKECRPEHPLGVPMVSEEGACAAYYHYQIETHGQPAS